MNLLPENFVFTQTNLQDYVDCPKRFYLKYIKRMSWPAIQEEPYLLVEQMMLRGQKFHHLIHQFFLGISPELVFSQVDDSDLSRWWNGFISYFNSVISETITNSELVYPEFSVFTFISEVQITAKYDLLIKTNNGEFIIYDWKTTRVKPRRQWLINRMQTRVYQFILRHCQENAGIPDFSKSEKIRMVYWFSEDPTSPEIFNYPNTQFAKDKNYLNTLIPSITQKGENDFYLTEDLWMCKFCVYRSYCDRGNSASNINDSFDPDVDPNLDNFEDGIN